MAAIDARRLNRTTLVRQMLSVRAELDVVEAARRAVALQAQEPASPYLSLWNRVEGFDAADLDRAFAQRQIVKASAVRLTLHAVAAVDHPTFYAAMLPYLRASRLYDNRFKSEGLSEADADALVPGLLELLVEPRSKAEVEAFCGSPRMWWALRTFAPLIHAVTGPPWSFGSRAQYVASGVSTEVGLDTARATLVWRYLEGFGPASAADIGTFTIFRTPVVRTALDDLAGSLVEHDGPDGVTLYDVPDGVIADARTPAPPRLLGMWDNVLLAYTDRARVLPDAYRQLVIRRNGDVLPSVLVDGHVAGVWRVIEGQVEVTPFHDLTPATWRGLTEEARRLTTMLADRDPDVYRRYHHWWDKLPTTDRRRL